MSAENKPYKGPKHRYRMSIWGLTCLILLVTWLGLLAFRWWDLRSTAARYDAVGCYPDSATTACSVDDATLDRTHYSIAKSGNYTTLTIVLSTGPQIDTNVLGHVHIDLARLIPVYTWEGRITHVCLNGRWRITFDNPDLRYSDFVASLPGYVFMAFAVVFFVWSCLGAIWSTAWPRIMDTRG